MEQESDSTGMTTNLIVGVFVLLGLLLIVVSVLIKEDYPYAYEFLKELGIVILAVFATSFIYEISVGKRYHREFLQSLQAQFERGENNAAGCERFGIQGMFLSRDELNQHYSLHVLFDVLGKDSSLRIVAKSGRWLLSDSAIIRNAIQRGAAVEICLFDHKSPKPASKSSDSPSDREFEEMAGYAEDSYRTLKSEIVDWLNEKHERYPQGSLTVKLHDVILSDSFLRITSEKKNFCQWDISFSRSTSDKRIFVLDPKGGLGEKLVDRYQKIWNDADIAPEVTFPPTRPQAKQSRDDAPIALNL
ncbi:MAG: hypothetical protein WAM82_00165 [Thermoanaerobaculia bacterium]